jgi:predicted DNA binding CopG/RHH family protein
MPVSRNRKNHKKKVAQRNQTRQQEAKKMQTLYNETLIKHLKDMHEEYVKSSGDTENNGFVQPTTNTEL